MIGEADDLFSRPVAALRLTERQRLDWLRLARCENVGPRTFRDLINMYGGAATALEALPTLSQRGGARALRIASAAEVEKEIASARHHGVRFVALGEPDYPKLLRRIASAPPILALKGDMTCFERPLVALVGSRNASVPGLKMAALLARALGEAGFTTVSGLARGIDAAVHKASLAAGTIAVLAGGQDRIYPSENEPLLAEIIATGAAVSERPMGHEPRAKDFPRRNRLIAGLALGTVVVEAAERSGSLITARMALEENREVFAVPGSPLDPRAAGTNRLIKQGAALVTTVDDILQVLAPMLERGIAEPPPDDEPLHPLDPGADARIRVANLLGPVPVVPDDLAREASLPAAVVRVVILELVLAGRAYQDSAGRVALS